MTLPCSLWYLLPPLAILLIGAAIFAAMVLTRPERSDQTTEDKREQGTDNDCA